MDRWVRQTRARRGLTLIDKFGALRQLPDLVAAGAPVGFVADQNGGDRGVFVPFFNRLASTYKSIGLLAMQFNATVLCGGAWRVPAGKRTLPRRPGLSG
jgi:KDO2-lipid IV(A) lauroyltransferase